MLLAVTSYATLLQVLCSLSFGGIKKYLRLVPDLKVFILREFMETGLGVC